MRRIRDRLTYANVISTLALFLVLTGGTAVALNGTNTVFTDDIANDTQPASGGNPAGGLVAADLRPGSVGSTEVIDGALNDEDIGNPFSFQANIGSVPAHDCVDSKVTGVNARLDHVLLSADWNTSPFEKLSYGVLHTSGFGGGDTGSVVIRTCNPTASAINDGTTNFKMIVIDAQ